MSVAGAKVHRVGAAAFDCDLPGKVCVADQADINTQKCCTVAQGVDDYSDKLGPRFRALAQVG